MKAFAETDVRPLLGSVKAPTLVVSRRDSVIDTKCSGRYLADHIAGARYIEHPGDSHIPWIGDGDAILDEIQELLTGTRPRSPDDRVLATVMFTDIVESTGGANRLGDARWRQLLDQHDELVRSTLEDHRGRQVKSTGDGVLAAFDGPARAIRCAVDLASRLPSLGIEIRAGLHSGEIEIRGDDIGGIAVHTGARVASLAGAGEVLVSSTVKDLVAGSGIHFDDRGEHELKGVPGLWRLYAVAS